jgi:hypothetical protein
MARAQVLLMGWLREREPSALAACAQTMAAILEVGLGRVVVSEKEAPNLLVNLV